MPTTAQPKIVIIGAGGVVFPMRLMGDLLSFPALQSATYSLMDIDLPRAERTSRNARALANHHGFAASISATDDLRSALTDAQYIFVTFQVGGFESYHYDVMIPRKYGLDQTVGDTLGPGGVFRFLRSVGAYREIASLIHEVAPGAQLINYANPMAMACWYLSDRGIDTVGLCHSVQGTSRMLARQLDVAYDDITFSCGGINHQAWFTRFRRGNEDLYPRLRETMVHNHLGRSGIDELEEDLGDHSGERGDSNYEGGAEKVRTAIMDTFGYFHTESSHHASEYLPYFRKTPALVDQFIEQRWDYYEISSGRIPEDSDRKQLDELKSELKPSLEYGAHIVNSMQTGQPTVIYGNVPNRDRLIDNLPPEACVEVACLVDANGVQPTHFGALPPQCASVNHTNINVQRMAVYAAHTGSRAAVEQAVALDPLTSALLTLDQIREMTNELLDAHAALLEGTITSP